MSLAAVIISRTQGRQFDRMTPPLRRARLVPSRRAGVLFRLRPERLIQHFYRL
jgi:hypothetical protein